MIKYLYIFLSVVPLKEKTALKIKANKSVYINFINDLLTYSSQHTR